MKTGDILLFKGNGVFSVIIMLLPSASYSHVGFYYDHPEFGPCVAESTSVGNTPDVITGELANGVQFTKFDDRVAAYDGEVFVKESTHTLTDEQLVAFDLEAQLRHGVPYEKDDMQLVNAQLDIFPWSKNKSDLSSIFCSEFCSLMLRKIGVIKEGKLPCNEFTPTDFDDNLDFNGGYGYGGAVQIK